MNKRAGGKAHINGFSSLLSTQGAQVAEKENECRGVSQQRHESDGKSQQDPQKPQQREGCYHLLLERVVHMT